MSKKRISDLEIFRLLNDSDSDSSSINLYDDESETNLDELNEIICEDDNDNLDENDLDENLEEWKQTVRQPFQFTGDNEVKIDITY